MEKPGRQLAIAHAGRKLHGKPKLFVQYVVLSKPDSTIFGGKPLMELVIHDVPAKLLEELDKKAKASGRSVEAEAAAIIATSLAEGDEEE